MLGAIGPRPIAFASTINQAGQVNLAPFSFFNAFGANPPILIFSPARSGRTNTNKDTFNNVKEVPEVVINVVSYDMVQQMSLSSCEFPPNVNEFVKAGFSEQPSVKVRPPRVLQSKVQIECKVNEVIETGDQGGAGNLVICEILMMHIDEQVLDENGKIDLRKLDLVGRMGGNVYCRANGEALFEVNKPGAKQGIGFDGLPPDVLTSSILTGNDLGILAGVEQLPDSEAISIFSQQDDFRSWVARFVNDPDGFNHQKHMKARQLIAQSNVEDAWLTLLAKL